MALGAVMSLNMIILSLILVSWQLRKTAPSPGYIPHMRPAAPYIIDLLPPAAYPDNPSTSLCTKFVHTSTNKVRGPVNCVTVSRLRSDYLKPDKYFISPIVDTDRTPSSDWQYFGRVYALERIDL